MKPHVRALCVATAVVAVLSTGPLAPLVGATPRTAVSPSVAAAPMQQWGAAEEQAFVAKINDLRTSRGLASLAVDAQLTDQARIWSQTMKDAGNIFHTTTLDAGITADWAKLGENVGVGGTVDALFDAFVASPKHFENLIDPLYRFVGIGVVWDGERMFTAHRFMAVLPPAAAPTPTAPKAPPTTNAPKSPVAPEPTAPPEVAFAEPAPEPEPKAPAVPEPPAAPAPPPADPQRVALVLDNLLGSFE